MTLLQALQELVAYLQDGNANRNPYSIPEVMAALAVIKHETGFQGDVYNANDEVLRRRKCQQK